MNGQCAMRGDNGMYLPLDAEHSATATTLAAAATKENPATRTAATGAANPSCNWQEESLEQGRSIAGAESAWVEDALADLD